MKFAKIAKTYKGAQKAKSTTVTTVSKVTKVSTRSKVLNMSTVKIAKSVKSNHIAPCAMHQFLGVFFFKAFSWFRMWLWWNLPVCGSYPFSIGHPINPYMADYIRITLPLEDCTSSFHSASFFFTMNRNWQIENWTFSMCCSVCKGGTKITY